MTTAKYIFSFGHLPLQYNHWLVLASTSFIHYKECLECPSLINSQIHNMSNSVQPVNLTISTKWLLNNHKGPFLVSIPPIKFLRRPKCTYTILLYSILIEISLILSVEARTSIVVTQTDVSEWKDIFGKCHYFEICNNLKNEKKGDAKPCEV